MGQVLFYFSRSRSNTEIFSYIKKIGCKKIFLRKFLKQKKGFSQNTLWYVKSFRIMMLSQ